MEEIKSYKVTLSLQIRTKGTEEMAKKIFSNIVSLDRHYPLLNLDVEKLEKLENIKGRSITPKN